MNDSQKHRPINDSLAKQKWVVKNLKRVQYLRVEYPFLKKKNLQIPSEEPLQRDLGPADGSVFIHGEGPPLSKEDTLEAAISQLEQLKSNGPSARLLLRDTTGIF